MGKVECFVLAGIQLIFYSADHLPPHFHAKKKQAWEIRVNFLESVSGNLKYELIWGKHPTAKDKKAILENVLNNKAKLLEEFEAKVCLK